MLNSDKILDINDKLDALQAAVCNLKNLIEQMDTNNNKIDDWMTEKSAMKICGLSRGTLLKLRKEGKISSSTLSGKQNFYRLSDFKNLLNENEKNR